MIYQVLGGPEALSCPQVERKSLGDPLWGKVWNREREQGISGPGSAQANAGRQKEPGGTDG